MEGSTTMHDILRELSQKNLFYYKKMDSSNMNFDDDESLTDYIRENMKKPFFYMQHHFFTNFTKYDNFPLSLFLALRNHLLNPADRTDRTGRKQ